MQLTCFQNASYLFGTLLQYAPYLPSSGWTKNDKNIPQPPAIQYSLNVCNLWHNGLLPLGVHSVPPFPRFWSAPSSKHPPNYLYQGCRYLKRIFLIFYYETKKFKYTYYLPSWFCHWESLRKKQKKLGLSCAKLRRSYG